MYGVFYKAKAKAERDKQDAEQSNMTHEEIHQSYWLNSKASTQKSA